MACCWVLLLEPKEQPAPTCSWRPVPWGGILPHPHAAALPIQRHVEQRGAIPLSLHKWQACEQNE